MKEMTKGEKGKERKQRPEGEPEKGIQIDNDRQNEAH